jgi:hypothetical protein
MMVGCPEPPVGPAVPVDRSAIAADYERCRADLHWLLSVAPGEELRARSDGTRWTNEQLLFHMVFGFLVVRRLLPLVRLVSRLPPPAGRGFAGVLDTCWRPFHVVNYVGSCAAALVFDRHRMGWLCDRTLDGLSSSLQREPEHQMGRVMPFPTRWDPYFTAVMTVEDVYRYPVLHYAHHRAQLTLRAAR